MSALVDHWSFDPFVIVATAVVAVHARGLYRLNRRAAPARARRRRRQAAWFYLGVVVLLVAVMSPVDYWSDEYLWMHMTQHLLLIFGAPVPIVVGAPWVPLLQGLPTRPRRVLVGTLARDRWASPLRRIGAAGWWPWFGVAGLSAALVFWHMPGPFDLAEDNQAVHIWLMHGSFFAFGVLFWLQFVDSRPFRVRLTAPQQIGAIFFLAVLMWVLAMAMSLLATGSWYTWYQVHEGSLLSPFADQQIGAGIMWICGDFWAVPAMIRACRRLIDERGGSLDAALDALLQGHGRVRMPARLHAEMAQRDLGDEWLARRRHGTGAGAGNPSSG